MRNVKTLSIKRDKKINIKLLFDSNRSLVNRIKSEIAENIWGKNEGANIRLKVDNQGIEALKHFHEANAFLKALN